MNRIYIFILFYLATILSIHAITPCDSIKFKKPVRPIESNSNGNDISITINNSDKIKEECHPKTLQDHSQNKEQPENTNYFWKLIKEILPNLITIILATAGAIFAIIQIKLNAITNARIEWIESVRENLSSFVKEINYLSSEINIMNEEIRKQFIVATTKEETILLRKRVTSVY